jgi:hypothetical protein
MTAIEESTRHIATNEYEDSDLEEEYAHMVNDAVTLLHEHNRSPLEHGNILYNSRFDQFLTCFHTFIYV